MIEPLIIKSKKQLFSSQAGIFSSPIGAEGFDFLEMREYVFGEDARRIDWIVSAKVGKPYVRLYQEERSRIIVPVPLLCNTLHFGSRRLKVETLLEAFLLIALSGVLVKEQVVSYHEGIRQLRDFYSVERFVKELAGVELLGRACAFDTKKLFYELREPSLVVLLGDFLDPVDVALLAQKHEVVAVVVRTRLEEGADIDIECETVDTLQRTTKSAHLSTATLRRYGRKLSQLRMQNYEHFAKVGVDWVEVFDDEDVFIKLQHFFMGR